MSGDLNPPITGFGLWHLEVPVVSRRDHGVGSVAGACEVIVLRLTAGGRRARFRRGCVLGCLHRLTRSELRRARSLPPSGSSRPTGRPCPSHHDRRRARGGALHRGQGGAGNRAAGSVREDRGRARLGASGRQMPRLHPAVMLAGRPGFRGRSASRREAAGGGRQHRQAQDRGEGSPLRHDAARAAAQRSCRSIRAGRLQPGTGAGGCRSPCARRGATCPRLHRTARARRSIRADGAPAGCDRGAAPGGRKRVRPRGHAARRRRGDLRWRFGQDHEGRRARPGAARGRSRRGRWAHGLWGRHVRNRASRIWPARR